MFIFGQVYFVASRYNNELVKCLGDLREKRELVNKSLIKEEKEKGIVQKQVFFYRGL